MRKIKVAEIDKKKKKRKFKKFKEKRRSYINSLFRTTLRVTCTPISTFLYSDQK
jgi:hypothetical protein